VNKLKFIRFDIIFQATHAAAVNRCKDTKGYMLLANAEVSR
jgi:hypothetical protein